MAALLASSYSYSEIVYDTSEVQDLNWVMQHVLPQQLGLEVFGLNYKYTVEKDPSADYKVSVQNENALGDGYIFRETDDWSGVPGNTIKKSFVLPNVDIKYWGDGSIESTGEGVVSDPYVQYIYRYDTCADPMTDPRCPGYALAWYNYLMGLGLFEEAEAYDPMKDQLVLDELNRKTKEVDDAEEQEEEIDREEIAKEAIESALDTAEAAALAAQFFVTPKSFDAYNVSIAGGYYPDAKGYVSEQLPENKKGLRVGLAQQLLHTEMVNSQYKGE